MNFCYYPGCTLKSTAKNLDTLTQKILKHFNINFIELPSWQCCGGIYPLNKNDISQRLSSFRVLNYCKENNLSLITVCSGCYNVLKRTNYDVKNDLNFNQKANSYLELKNHYNGETSVFHLLEVLKNHITFETISKNIKKPLTKKYASYYGCLMIRPSSILNTDNMILENLVSSLGGKNINFGLKDYCCGSYKMIDNKDIVKKNIEKITQNALLNGAECIITSCPLCYFNLKKYSSLDVKYFVEIIAEALGLME